MDELQELRELSTKVSELYKNLRIERNTYWETLGHAEEEKTRLLHRERELVDGLKAAIRAIEYAEGTCYSSSMVAVLWSHCNGYQGSPDIRKLVEGA